MPDTTALDMGTNARHQPALSATSDAPVIPTPVVEKAEPAVVESATAAPEVATTEGENADTPAVSDHDSGEGSTAKPKGGFQKRIDELTRQREETRREKEEYARRLDEALALLKERQEPERKPEPRHESTDDPRPVRDQYDDPDGFSEALSQWSARQAIKSYEAEQRARADQERASGEFQKVLNQWDQGRVKAIEQHPDYEAVAMNPDLQVAQHVGMALLHVPNGHEVLYYLGQHPEEAARISALGAPFAAIEIGRLSYQVATPPPTSRAPAPVSPLTGNRDGAGPVAPEDDPNYMERRLAEMRTKKR